MDYLLACELAGAVAIGAAGHVRQVAGHEVTPARLVWHAFCNGDKLRQTRGVIAAFCSSCLSRFVT